MPNISFKLPKGFYANGTSHDKKGRWTDGSLVRWIDNTLRPIGGSRRWVNVSHGTSAYRGKHSWLSLSKTKYIAFGAFDKFKASKGAGDTFFDLTPADLNSGRLDAEYEDGYGYGFYGKGSFGKVSYSETSFIVSSIEGILQVSSSGTVGVFFLGKGGLFPKATGMDWYADFNF